MKRLHVILAVVGLAALVATAILASRVGGIAIRNDLTLTGDARIVVSQPLIPGTPASVRWDPAEFAASLDSNNSGNVQVYWRTKDEEVIIGQAETDAGRAIIEMPCEATAASGTLIVQDKDTKQIIASQGRIEVLPPGPECVAGIQISR